MDTSLHVRLRSGDTGIRRRNEPVTGGIPLPRGACADVDLLRILDETGRRIAAQAVVSERWPDGSIRWLLLDLCADSPSTYRLQLTTDRARDIVPSQSSEVRPESGSGTIDTGKVTFILGRDDCLCTVIDSKTATAVALVKVVANDRRDRPARVRVGRVEVETTGAVRSSGVVSGTIEFGPQVLELLVRFHFFSESCAVRAEVRVRNPRRAVHTGNFWELGDANSVLLRDVSIQVDLPKPVTSGMFVGEPGADPVQVSAPASLYQESSGGEHWSSKVHVNREGRVPLRFRGFRLESPEVLLEGARAQPVLTTLQDGRPVSASIRHFWQNFPKSLELTPTGITIRLFPQQFPDLHEIQGGEQKTHVIGLAFGDDPVGPFPLSWIVEPSVLSVEPHWYARSEAVPYLTPSVDSTEPEYEDLVRAAIDGPDAFEHKRERVDEYGWRNFGDIYADHETVGHPGLVSHYNNQYDAIAGFAIQFMRSGDLRWWSAMEELAAHVIDIDLYHTTEDKAAFNGGQFWHTAHYTDAGRSTHRTYPRIPSLPGGGPSNEQDYATGFLLHYLLTGSAASRGAVLQLAGWVLAMDDGRRTVFRWLSRKPTGLASSTHSTDYHGPGRGAANSILTLMHAHRLTHDPRFLEKAESLIRRCIHPLDNLEQRELLDAERRWSYIVFLQVIGKYLDEKLLMDQRDDRYGYARASLLHYARWMAVHEYPYLDKPEILEFPNETWTAQDVRKSEVFAIAALHALEEEERPRFLERSDFFFRSSVDTLVASPNRTLARPVVLMLSYGHAVQGIRRAPVRPPSTAEPGAFGSPTVFRPQKTIAFERARILGIAILSAIGVALVVYVLA
jgi:hypothetical protein